MEGQNAAPVSGTYVARCRDDLDAARSVTRLRGMSEQGEGSGPS